MDLTALPEEVLVLVLSHVPPDSLLQHCRLVCRKWRDILDSQSPWKLKCERDGCVPRGIDQVRGAVHIDWSRCFLKKPFNKNLIKNPCGEDGFQNWQKKDGGHGWATEENRADVPEATSQKCFASSFRWCMKKQTVDLLVEGLWEEMLDIYQPDICISDWYGSRFDCGCDYNITVRLLAEDKKTVIAKFEKNPPVIPQWTGDVNYKVSCVFRNYGQGVRYVNFFHRGKDTEYWAGHYGARVTNSTVIVSLTRTEDLPDGEIIEKGNEASGGMELYEDDDWDDDPRYRHGNMDWESSEDLGPSDDSDDSADEFFDGDYVEDAQRMQNTNWCTCSNCAVMENHTNCYCCREVNKILHVMEAETPVPDCITNHPGFEGVCLNPWVLHTAFYGFRWEELMEDLPLPERYRVASHKQFAQWCRLYRGIGIPLPSCVMLKIQSAFPLEGGVLPDFLLH